MEKGVVEAFNLILATPFKHSNTFQPGMKVIAFAYKFADQGLCYACESPVVQSQDLSINKLMSEFEKFIAHRNSWLHAAQKNLLEINSEAAQANANLNWNQCTHTSMELAILRHSSMPGMSSWIVLRSLHFTIMDPEEPTNLHAEIGTKGIT